jgi:hypothetical protein
MIIFVASAPAAPGGLLDQRNRNRLTAGEAFVAGGCSVIIEHCESNLLGLYLSNNRSFPKGHDLVLLDDTIWQEIQARPEFKRKKEADRRNRGRTY